jgi:hypothetical protein
VNKFDVFVHLISTQTSATIPHMRISVLRSSGGKVKLIVGDVLEELNVAEFNRLIDQCIKVRNQMTDVQERTPDRAA